MNCWQLSFSQGATKTRALPRANFCQQHCNPQYFLSVWHWIWTQLLLYSCASPKPGKRWRAMWIILVITQIHKTETTVESKFICVFVVIIIFHLSEHSFRHRGQTKYDIKQNEWCSFWAIKTVASLQCMTHDLGETTTLRLTSSQALRVYWILETESHIKKPSGFWYGAG